MKGYIIYLNEDARGDCLQEVFLSLFASLCLYFSFFACRLSIHLFKGKFALRTTDAHCILNPIKYKLYVIL
jgi:hypothetical protein